MKLQQKTNWYRLRKEYGIPIDIKHTKEGSLDVITGEVTQTIVSIHLPRVLVLTGAVRPRFFYDIGYLAANKNFTYGGDVLQRTITVVLNLKDFELQCRKQNIAEEDRKIPERSQIFIKDVRYQVRTPHINPVHDLMILECRDIGDSEDPKGDYV